MIRGVPLDRVGPCGPRDPQVLREPLEGSDDDPSLQGSLDGQVGLLTKALHCCLRTEVVEVGVLTPKGLPLGAGHSCLDVHLQGDYLAVVRLCGHWVSPMVGALGVCSAPYLELGVWHCYFDHYSHCLVGHPFLQGV